MKMPTYPFFSLDEFRARLDAARALMEERGIDVLLLNTPENIYYLSGYQTPGYYYYMALVVPLNREPILVPPPHEESMVSAFSCVDDFRLFHDTTDPVDGVAALLDELGFASGRIGVEKNSWFLKVDEFERLQGLMPGADFIDGSGLIEQGRMIKSPAEIGYMREAAHVAEAGARAGLAAVRVGVTEHELGVEIARAQLGAGSEYSGLPTFITSGERSMLVHSVATDRKLVSGDPVFFEVPGVIHRYHATMTRAAYIGDPPQLLLDGSEVNRDALRLAKETIKPGVTVSDAFEVARRRIDDADVPYVQGRRVAYGLGSAFPPGWDEGHIISINSNEHRAFEPGMAFHLITTMRLPGLGAIGCSDTVLVTEDGCETLTSGVLNEVHVV